MNIEKINEYMALSKMRKNVLKRISLFANNNQDTYFDCLMDIIEIMNFECNSKLNSDGDD